MLDWSWNTAVITVIAHNIFTNTHNIFTNTHNIFTNTHNIFTNTHNIFTNTQYIHKYNNVLKCISTYSIYTG